MITMSSAADVKSLWAEEAVGDDVACSGCGYNLRSMKQGQLCPECGEPVTMSLVMFHFRRSRMPAMLDPTWVQQILEGASLVLLALVASMVLGLWVGSEHLWGTRLIPFFGIQVAAWCLNWVGIWKLTRGPITGDHNGFDAFWRQSLRALASFYALVPVVFAAADGGVAFDVWLDTVIFLFSLLGMLTSFCLYQHLRQLARRVRSITFQTVMTILSLIVPWFIPALFVGNGSSGSRSEYALTTLLLLPGAPLPRPRMLVDAAQNVMDAMSQSRSIRGESILFLLPLLVSVALLSYIGWLLVRWLMTRSPRHEGHDTALAGGDNT
jgi:hypothetical protein